MADSDAIEVEFWGCAHLQFPEGPEREEARRAVALNFASGAEGLPKDWEKDAEKILAFLKAEPKFKVVQLRAVPDDPAA